MTGLAGAPLRCGASCERVLDAGDCERIARAVMRVIMKQAGLKR